MSLRNILTISLFSLLTSFSVGKAYADDSYAEALKSFRFVDATAPFFKNAYGYAVFPSVGKGGFIVGGAYGKGRVYKHGNWVGNSTLVQGTVGFQLGGQVFSEIIFFKNKDAYDDFTKDGFEFGGEASVVAITAGASASAGTTGTAAGASGGSNNATGKADYYRGMATFTIAKGGLMYQATLGGQKFSFEPK